MARDLTITVSQFKARSLKLVDDVAVGRLTQITVTKRGKAVAILSPIIERPLRLADVHGFMRAVTSIAAGTDLEEPSTDPGWEERMLQDWDAEAR